MIDFFLALYYYYQEPSKKCPPSTEIGVTAAFSPPFRSCCPASATCVCGVARKECVASRVAAEPRFPLATLQRGTEMSEWTQPHASMNGERCVEMAESHRGDIWPFSIPIGAQVAPMGAGELQTSRVAALERRTGPCRSPNLHGFLTPPRTSLLRYWQLRQKARFPQLDAHWSSTSQWGWRLPAARWTRAAIDACSNARALVDKVVELVAG